MNLTDDEVKILRLLRNIRSEWRSKRDVIVVLVLSDNSAEIGAVAPKGMVQYGTKMNMEGFVGPGPEAPALAGQISGEK